MANIGGGMVAGFSASEFVRDEFEAQEFVAMARRSVPLDELVKDLSAHLADLKMSLVDAINQDYAAFVGMASSLKGLDKALSRVRTPVESLRAEVQQIRDAAAAAAEQVDGKLEERRVLLKTERRLALLLDVELGVCKLERLLENSNLQNSDEPAKNLTWTSVLERIAHELARLKGQVHRLEDENNTSMRKDLVARIEFVEDSLLSRINAIFSTIVQFSAVKDCDESNPSTSSCRYSAHQMVLDQIMRAYFTLNRPDACEITVRQFAVEPFLAHRLTVSALEAGVIGSCSGLMQVYEAIVNFIDEHCLPLAGIAANALESEMDVESDFDDVYDLLKVPRSEGDNSTLPRGKTGTWVLADPSFYIRSCIFPPLSASLLAIGGRRLTQYLDKGFQNKYNSTMEFLCKLEVRCGSREGALALRSHAAYQDFLHKWDLPLRAYFQLRFQEVTDFVGPLLTTPNMLVQALEEEAAAAAKAAAAAAKAAAAASPAPHMAANGTADSPAPLIPAQALPAAPPPVRPPLPPFACESAAESWLVEGLGLEASVTVWKALVGVWGDGLPALVQRGLQLSLLLLERYTLWAREWSDFLSKRVTAPAAERDSDAAGGARRGDDEVRVVAMMAHDCATLGQRAGSELGGEVEKALVHVLMSEAAAQPSIQLVRAALASASGEYPCTASDGACAAMPCSGVASVPRFAQAGQAQRPRLKAAGRGMEQTYASVGAPTGCRVSLSEAGPAAAIQSCP